MTEITTMRDALRERILAYQHLAPAADALVEASLPGLSLRKSNEAPLPYGSFLGGVPYLPAGEEWPLDPQGVPMLLLIQLNFADLQASAQGSGVDANSTSLDGAFPTSGLLQVFLGTDSCLGFEEEGMEMRFFPEPSGGFAEASGAAAAPVIFENEKKLDVPFVDRLSNIMAKPLGLVASFDLIPCSDEYAFEEILEYEGDDAIWDEYEDFYYSARQDSPIFLGGFPSFTQNPYLPENHYHLIQFDSDGSEDWGIEMTWGGCGIAHLFVETETLARMRAGEPITLRTENEGFTDGVTWYYDCD